MVESFSLASVTKWVHKATTERDLQTMHPHCRSILALRPPVFCPVSQPASWTRTWLQHTLSLALLWKKLTYGMICGFHAWLASSFLPFLAQFHHLWMVKKINKCEFLEFLKSWKHLCSCLSSHLLRILEWGWLIVSIFFSVLYWLQWAIEK